MKQSGEHNENKRSSDPSLENEVAIKYQTEIENEKLYSIFMQAPAIISVLRGPEHIFELANPKYMQLIGVHRNILGRTVKDALPEIAEQGLIEILDEVYRSKQAFVGNEMQIMLDQNGNGILQEVFINFVFQPTLDNKGNIYGIFVNGVDVTEQVINRRRIEESEEKYRTMLDKINQGFCIIEVLFDENNKPVDYRFIEINPTFERQTGLQNPIGKTARELVPNLESHWFEIYGKIALTGEPANFIEGSEAMGRWFEVNAFRVGGKESRRVALFFTDISERNLKEVELKESEARFRNLADTAPIFLAMADDAGQAVYFNKPWLQWTGKNMEEMRGLGWLCTLHPEDAPLFERDFKYAFQNQIPIREQYRFRRADGEYRWMLAVGAPRIQDGKFIGYFGTYTDFHELKQAQDALIESEKRYRTLIEEATVATGLYIGPEIRIQYVNDIMLKYWGKDNKVIGKTFAEAIPELKDQPFLGYLQNVYKSGEPYIGTEEEAQIIVDGKLQSFYFNFTYKALRTETGEIYGIHHTAIDVTQEVLAKKALAISEERLSLALQVTRDGVWDWDFKNDKAWWDDRYVEIIGVDIPEEERSLRAVSRFIQQEDVEKINAALKALLEEGKEFEVEYRTIRPSGEIRYVYSKGKAVTNKKGEVTRLTGTLSDITESKKAEEEKQKLLAIIEASMDYVGLASLDGKGLYVNPAGLKMVGWESLEGRYIIENIYPEDRPLAQNILIPKLIQEGHFSHEIRFWNNKTKEVVWVLWNGITIKDPSTGEIIALATISPDISERKKAEMLLKQKNEELVRINNDLDNFIYTASHDLKAPMSNIEGLLNALKSELELEKDRISEETNILLELMQKSINRFKTTILDLTEITKVQKGQEEDIVEINLSQTVEDVKLSIYDKIVESKATIETNFSQVNKIKFSKKNLKSIIYNLIGNAIKYRDKDRSPEILIKSEKIPDYTVINVIDNGLGISKENQSKIFGMFKRVHDHVEGTGIGLYIVKRIIDNSGGKIEVESEVGKGTTFKIYFPMK